MNALVFNCGSSSLKYSLLSMPEERELAGGEAQRIGPRTAEPSRIARRVNGREETVMVEMRDHAAAFEEVMALLAREPGHVPDALGHRMVHGGARFDRHAVVNDGVVADLLAAQRLAPIHNPPATRLVRFCRERLPRIPQVVVFDTVFHSSIPKAAWLYALPREARERLGLRKYGFHGVSHNYVAEEAARFLGMPRERLNAVSCHLGSGGASLCAIVAGRSIDNTMGYTPLQGLIMSTRAGDLDPAVTLRLLERARRDPAAAEKWLNQQSGVLGMSGVSADVRDVLALADGRGEDSRRATLTVQAYMWRIRKYLGAYLALVGRADAVIFTDTIGETAPWARWGACAGMEVFGLQLDAEKNRRTAKLPADLAADESPTRILAIHTNEELAIARQTYALLARAG